MKHFLPTTVAAALAGLLLAGPARADITIGFVTSLSGGASSIGVPYGRGIAAAKLYRGTVGGETIKLIQLDDGSDPSAATRNARKLIEEEKVDLLIGTATGPSTLAMTAVATELHVPMIAIAPIPLAAGDGAERWVVCDTQPPPLMVKAITDRIKRDGTKTIGFIGFSDGWGDLVYGGAKAAEEKGELKLTANERYARTDNSVTGQVLKLSATRPEGVLDGGSGTQGALPLLSLADRGYKGRLYGTPALVNPDFVRVGGKAAEGIQVSVGPVIVAEQLPDDHFAKAISLTFRDVYQKANGVPTTDGFSAYAFDAWLIMLNAAERALPKAKPGTQEFRAALNAAILSTKELAGTQAVYTFTPSSPYGVDDRGMVVVRLVNGAWTYAP